MMAAVGSATMCTVSLACPQCGSEIDQAAHKVAHVACQTLYCDEACLTKDAESHALWCKEEDEQCKAAFIHKGLYNIGPQFYLKDRMSKPSNPPFFIMVNGGETGTTSTALIFESNMPNHEWRSKLLTRIHQLLKKFPLASHLCTLAATAFNEEAYAKGQLHLFKISDSLLHG